MHVRQLPSGRWRFIVQFAGQRADGTAATRGQAFLAGSQALIGLGHGRPAVDMTVKDLLDVWQAERQRKWSPTYAADMATVTAKLPAAFTDRDIATVTPPIVAALLRQLTAEGWSAHRVGRANVAVSQAFLLGVEYGWAAGNPARDVRAPEVAGADVSAPPPEVVGRLLLEMPARIYLAVRLAALMGARLGELVALRWADVDNGVLSIRRAAVYTPASGLVVRNTTKSGRKGDRRLDIDDRTLKLLDERRVEQFADAAARQLPEPVYIFSHDAGVTPWRPGYLGLAYRRVRDQVDGGHEVRFHDLRHHVATEMLADGLPPVAVAAQLGHSTPATTMRVYAHYLPGQGGESLRRRAARFDD